MLIRRLKDHVVIDQLDIFSLEILRLIPVSANPEGCREAEDRLYSRPELVEGEFTEDWEAYVKPELHHLFQSATETVETDLNSTQEIVPDEGGIEYRLKVPGTHVEAWVNAVNQARLVIAAKHRFNSADLEGGLPDSIESPRDMALLQIHLYDFLLLSLLQELE